jgi:pyridoxamine 5'-phosphate oxidase
MTTAADPISLFDRWYEEAQATEADAFAASLATATPDGRPSSRMVLVKHWGPEGFVVYTNLGSRKARELGANPHAALLWHWKTQKRQIRAEGPMEPVSDEEADAYFAARPRLSQIGAWASRQSEPLSGRLELERRVAATVARFPVGAVPRPDFWSGFRLRPERIEFWEDRDFRLHTRWLHRRTADGWTTTELYP